MAHHRLATAAMSLLLLTFAAGCASNGDADTTAGTAPNALEVSATEFSFDPAEVTAAADQAVEVTFRNEGSVEHEWVVLTAGTTIASEDEFEEQLVAFELEAGPGEETVGSFTLPAGPYQLVCAVPGHFAAGMQGNLTLE
jgi:plastocyanin